MSHLVIYNNSRDQSIIGLIECCKKYNIIIINNSTLIDLPILNSDSIKYYDYDIRSPQSLFKLNQFYIQNLKSIGEVEILINGGRSSYTLPQFYISRNFLDKKNIYYRELGDEDDLRVILSDPNFDGLSHIFEPKELGNLGTVFSIL